MKSLLKLAPGRRAGCEMAKRLRVMLVLPALGAGAGVARGELPLALHDPIELGAGVTPGIAASSDGALHVVYMEGARMLYRKSGDGRAFGPAEEIPAPAGETNLNSPHVVGEANGTVHVVFGHNLTGSAKRAWYTHRQGGRWRQPLLVLERGEPNRRVNYPRLAVAGDTAWVGAFTAGGSTLVQLAGVRSTPRVAATFETPLWVAHPFVSKDQGLLVVGRQGASGHRLQRFTAAHEKAGEALLLSRGTPTKSFEATGATMDADGIVHVVGATGSPNQVLWYTTSERAARGEAVVLGPELGHEIKEYTFPVVAVDSATRRVWVAYREHPAGVGKIAVLERGAKAFSAPVTFASEITRRLRWNAPVAVDGAGAAWVVWDAGGKVFARKISLRGLM